MTRLLSETGSLRHLYLFGSFTTAKPNPGDLDCLAVMAAGFTTVNLPAHLLDVFQHDLCRFIGKYLSCLRKLNPVSAPKEGFKAQL